VQSPGSPTGGSHGPNQREAHSTAVAVPFSLRPFPGDPAPKDLRIDGSASRAGERLTLQYRLCGALSQLLIPPLSVERRRCDALWRSTCLEAFLGIAGDSGYWELNLSPAGHWNLYRLEGYRLDLRPEPACQAPVLRRHDAPEALEMQLALTLPPALHGASRLELGITAVIEGRQGEQSHWALMHPGERPDFHRREGFSLRL